MEQLRSGQRLIKLPSVLERFGSSRATLYRAVKSGLMTAPVKTGEKASAWPEYEVDAIQAARIAGLPDDEIRALVTALQLNRQRHADQIERMMVAMNAKAVSVMGLAEIVGASSAANLAVVG
jgi:prophage regulatory protein